MLRCLTIILFCFFLNGINEAESHCSPYSGGQNHFICQDVSSLSELNVPADAETLVIKNSEIHSIPPKYFRSKVSNLHSLQMRDQGVEEVSPEAFSGLDLYELDLSQNSITSLHSLDGNFEAVDFSQNRISSIDQETFSGRSNLRFVNLENNRLENLGPGSFKGCFSLQKIVLSQNQISNVDQRAFEGAENLKYLDLSGNQIADLSPEIFSGLQDLFLLNLTGNVLTVIREGWFSDFQHPLNFFAADNKIRSAEPNAFTNARKLGQVDLSHNELSHITGLCGTDLNLNHNQLTDQDADSVIRCPLLEKLNMAHNNVKKLILESFEGTNLQEFSFAHNAIEEFDLTILSKLKNGNSANLDHNQIKTLHENAGGDIKLKDFSLEHNQIEQIGKNIFKTFVEIEYLKLRLAHNAISTIVPGGLNTFVPNAPEAGDNPVSHLQIFLEHNILNTFGNWFVDGSSVEYLNVSHSKIQKVDSDSLKGAHFLSDLDLSHNEISQIAENAFISPNLKKLFLGHNQLTALANDIIVNCTKLATLDFSFNNIEVIEPNAFKNLVNLEKFYIQNNHLTAFSETIFAGFSHLNYVNVSSNAIETLSVSEGKSFVLDTAHNPLTGVSEVLVKSTPFGKVATRFGHDKIVRGGILGL